MTLISSPIALLSSVRSCSVGLPGEGVCQHFVELGSPDGPPLVLLHGYTDSWCSFEPLFDRLGRSFHLLVPDQRGHGGSDATDHYAIADFASDAVSFIEATVGWSVHLVDYSLGRHIPNLTAIHYLGIGHAPHWETPARVAQDIANFLASIEEETVTVKKDDRHHA